MDKTLVTIFGILGSLFVYWYFFGKKEQTVEASGEVNVIVEGGYKPETISVPVGKVTKINFLRKDPNSCLEEINLPDFRIKQYLPLNKPITIEIKPSKIGNYEIVCGMNMFHGKLIVHK